MTVEESITWHLTSANGWVEGSTESNLPDDALVTLKTEVRKISQREGSIKSFKEYHVANNDILRDAYSRFGKSPILE